MPQINEEETKLEKIDLKDKKILDILKENSREYSTQMAKKVALSKDAVAYRINRMEKLGIIDRYSLEVDNRAFNLKKFYLLFDFFGGKPEKEERLINFLKGKKEITNMIAYSDKINIKAEVLLKDYEELDLFLDDVHKKFGDIIIKITVLIEIIEDKKEFEEIDERDEKIIDILKKNSSESLVEISKKLNANVDTIAYRIKNLSENGIIKSFSVVPNLNKIGLHLFNLLLLTNGIENEKIKSVLKEKLAVMANRTFGDWSYILEIHAQDHKDFVTKINRIISIFGNSLKDYDTLVAYKEIK